MRPRRKQPVRGHTASAFEEDPTKAAAAAAAGAKPGLDLGQQLSVSKLLPSETPIAADKRSRRARGQRRPRNGVIRFPAESRP
jgi:hypothetical protein